MTLALSPDHHDHELEEHDRGLVYDLTTLDRRRMLKFLGFGGLSASMFVIAGCGPSGFVRVGVGRRVGHGLDRVVGCRGELRDHPRRDRRPVPG